MLVALVGLADEPDRLGKSKHEVSALVSSDALIGRHAVDTNLVLVQRIGDVRHEPGEKHAVHFDLLLEPGLDVVLYRPQLLLPELHRVLHHPVGFGGPNG